MNTIPMSCRRLSLLTIILKNWKYIHCYCKN